MKGRRTDRADTDRQKDKPHSLNTKVMANTNMYVD